MKQANPEFYVYWIKSGSKYYIGSTNDISKRLRQHNGEICGGAKRTKLTQTQPKWEIKRLISGFTTKSNCVKFEYAFQHQTKVHIRKGKNLSQRLLALKDTLLLYNGIDSHFVVEFF
jgi:predicted GIY-YIG superfamily endonuclease